MRSQAQARLLATAFELEAPLPARPFEHAAAGTGRAGWPRRDHRDTELSAWQPPASVWLAGDRSIVSRRAIVAAPPRRSRGCAAEPQRCEAERNTSSQLAPPAHAASHAPCTVSRARSAASVSATSGAPFVCGCLATSPPRRLHRDQSTSLHYCCWALSLPVPQRSAPRYPAPVHRGLPTTDEMTHRTASHTQPRKI